LKEFEELNGERPDSLEIIFDHIDEVIKQDTV
jgi:hypothetical protein